MSLIAVVDGINDAMSRAQQAQDRSRDIYQACLKHVSIHMPIHLSAQSITYGLMSTG